ncbi:MAG: PorT family protein [Hymenobacteraceae bacterium]|nr:PorT family protein [Hymenobacteraceae bacterium]MDX5397390.1 PorT family protein [Hymenobacteraceae bacterium]MDX5443588.1 PorT family protein [Hymenobacteraceae bacterium]MDX5513468.1 PorT family protein [Hymenobacteraceae bacterium]
MKKTFLLLALFLFTFAGFAQHRITSRAPENHNLASGERDNDGFGVKGGLNYSYIRGNDKPSSADARAGWHAGLYGQYSISENFSVQLEALYSRKGYDSANNIVNRYDYFDVPLLFVWNFLDNVSLHVGPQASLMVAAKRDDKEIDMEPYNTFDYGFAAGLEGRVSIVRVGARYNMGFADLRKKADDLVTDINQDIKNGVFQVYLGVGF